MVGKNAISLGVFHTKTRISLVVPEPSQLFSYSPLHLEEMNGKRRPDRSQIGTPSGDQSALLNITPHCHEEQLLSKLTGNIYWEPAVSRSASDLCLIYLMHVLTSPIATTRSTEILGHILGSWSILRQARTCPRVFWEAGDYQVLHDALSFLALGSVIPQQDCYCGNLNRSYCNNIFGQRARANLAIAKKKSLSHTKAVFLKYTSLKKACQVLRAPLSSQIGANKEHLYWNCQHQCLKLRQIIWQSSPECYSLQSNTLDYLQSFLYKHLNIVYILGWKDLNVLDTHIVLASLAKSSTNCSTNCRQALLGRSVCVATMAAEHVQRWTLLQNCPEQSNKPT